MKKLLVCITSVMFSFVLQGAPDNFTVKAPTWTKLAKGEDVIVYKFPSIDAPKCIFNWNTMLGYNPYTSAKWSSLPLSDTEDYLYMTNMSPILAEKSGWYEIPNGGPSFENGWIKEASCYTLTPMEVVPGRHNSSNFQWVDSPGDPAGGNYAMYVQKAQSYGNVYSFGRIYVGREIDGMVVCPYFKEFTIQYDDNGEVIIDFGDFEIKPKANEVDDLAYPILSKLSYKILDSIFSTAIETNEPIVIFLSPSGGEYVEAPLK